MGCVCLAMPQHFTFKQAILLFILATIWTLGIISIIYYYAIDLGFSVEVLIHGGIIILILLFIHQQQHNKTRFLLSDDLQAFKLSVRFAIIALLTGLGLFLLDTISSVYILQADIQQQAQSVLIQARKDGMVSSTLAACLLAPLMEEVLFRGVLLPAFSYKAKQYIGIIASAMLFSLIHFSMEQAVILFIAGVCFGILRIKSQSIWPPFFAHFTNNTLAWSAYMLMN